MSPRASSAPNSSVKSAKPAAASLSPGCMRRPNPLGENRKNCAMHMRNDQQCAHDFADPITCPSDRGAWQPSTHLEEERVHIEIGGGGQEEVSQLIAQIVRRLRLRANRTESATEVRTEREGERSTNEPATGADRRRSRFAARAAQRRPPEQCAHTAS